MKKINLQIVKEARDLIYNALNQGDPRYNDSYAEDVLTSFLINQAISVEENEFPSIEKPKQENLMKHRVQGEEKYIASVLLKLRGFNDSEIFFERNFFGSMPDVLAEKEGLIVLVECCSCRVSKIIEYISQSKEVWVLTYGENPWEEKPSIEKMQWFIFKKGINWDRIYSNFQKQRVDEIKKIKSPIDSL